MVPEASEQVLPASSGPSAAQAIRKDGGPDGRSLKHAESGRRLQVFFIKGYGSHPPQAGPRTGPVFATSAADKAAPLAIWAEGSWMSFVFLGFPWEDFRVQILPSWKQQPTSCP